MGLVDVIGQSLFDCVGTALTAVMLFGRDIEPGANLLSAERPY